MNDNRLSSLGIKIPSVLLPQSSRQKQSTDLQKWAVIACDQYTQDSGYWERVKAVVGDAPSTLNLIIPEIFLFFDEEASKRIDGIHKTMEQYLNDGIFAAPKNGFIYIERDTPYQKKRRGLIAAIDLEQYDWKPDSRTLIRCTEGTVPERLPARMNIRRDALLEFPHVLVLVDDDTDSLLSGLAEMVKKDEPLYDTQLMLDSGSIKGWFLDTEKPGQIFESFIAERLNELLNRSVSRYKGGAGQPFLFAVGDGNHSLAAAKGIWDEYKAAYCKNGILEHPCRYALIEIENIYDPAIQFEPIHRLVFGLGYDKTISLLEHLPGFNCRSVKTYEELSLLADKSSAVNLYGIISAGRYALIETSAAGISTACLQPLLDTALDSDKSLSIDYIHDKEELFRLICKNINSTGILLPPVQKAGLFETIARIGPLPRKSFSMGHSCEKRFYLEGRRLR